MAKVGAMGTLLLFSAAMFLFPVGGFFVSKGIIFEGMFDDFELGIKTVLENMVLR